MKRKVLFVALAAALCLLWFLFLRAYHSGTGVSSAGSPSDSESALRVFMGIFEEAARQGALVPEKPVAKELADVIADGDRNEIMRTFHEAVLHRMADLDATRAACLDLLKHPDWFVRKLAAESLYTMGDSSGFEVLRDLLTSPSPLMYADVDERIQIAIKFGQWRERRAGQHVLQAYNRIQDRELVFPMLNLGVPEAIAIYHEMTGGAITAGSAGIYGKANAVSHRGEIVDAYRKMPEGSVGRAYAGWALYVLSPEPEFLSDLRQIGDPARFGKAANPGDQAVAAYRCLASIRDPEVKRLMEDSLHSPSKNIRATAAASLLLVQEGKSEALRLFLKDHVGREGGQRIDWALGYQMAAYLNDPDVNAAGEARDRTGAEGAWRLYGVKRKNWPVYPWADGLLILP